jgi:hypothetical protein
VFWKPRAQSGANHINSQGIGEVVAVINGDGYAQVFLIATILLSATAAQAGATITMASADGQPAASSSAQPPTASSLAQPPDADAIAAQTSNQDSAENGNPKAEADGNAERDAASSDTHAPSVCVSQIQTKVARALMRRLG